MILALTQAEPRDLVMEENHWREELKRCTESCVVDAEDSSAWIYSNWLLAGPPASGERERFKCFLSFVKTNPCASAQPVFVTIDKAAGRSNVSFEGAVNANDAKEGPIKGDNASALYGETARSDYAWLVHGTELR